MIDLETRSSDAGGASRVLDSSGFNEIELDRPESVAD
jgi:hypothetical protein